MMNCLLSWYLTQIFFIPIFCIEIPQYYKRTIYWYFFTNCCQLLIKNILFFCACFVCWRIYSYQLCLLTYFLQWNSVSNITSYISKYTDTHRPACAFTYILMCSIQTNSHGIDIVRKFMFFSGIIRLGLVIINFVHVHTITLFDKLLIYY